MRYLSRKRIYRHGDILLEIPPGVFHPGYFFSTKLLLNSIDRLQLKGKTLLELGAGSGLISIYAARKGAVVTATDINPVAVDCIKKNSERNQVEFKIIQSDLFRDIPPQRFDIMAINPPFYKKKPITAGDFAWYCGENGEYFSGLFNRLINYIHDRTAVMMVFSEECDLKMIEGIASAHGFGMQKILTKKAIWEYLYIYRVTIEN